VLSRNFHYQLSVRNPCATKAQTTSDILEFVTFFEVSYISYGINSVASNSKDFKPRVLIGKRTDPDNGARKHKRTN
jgi:hypothetical protein